MLPDSHLYSKFQWLQTTLEYCQGTQELYHWHKNQAKEHLSHAIGSLVKVLHMSNHLTLHYP